MTFNHQSLRDPGDNKDESPDPKKPNNTGMVVLWLVVAFVPSVVALALLGFSSPEISPVLLILGVGCCLVSGFGIARTMKNSVAQILGGLLISIVFFALNIVIVILIGCSRMQI